MLCVFSPALAGEDDVVVERLRPDTSAFTDSSGFGDPGQYVLRDQAAWGDLWKRVHARSHPVPPLPEIDFGREIVVVVALGHRPSSGYAIRVGHAYKEGPKTVVVVQTESPAAGCIVLAAMTSPVDIARLPAPDGPVEFRIESTIRDCN
jgi:hypothetical protein